MNKPASRLAIFGGLPAFRESLHVGRPNIGNRRRFLERIEDVLDSRLLTNDGPLLQEFERRVAEYVGVEHCVAMCNATLALEITARALGMTGEVITPSFTFVGTAHALQWQQITPVFCDIDPWTHTLDPRSVERLITPRTTGILAVHLWGRPCHVEALEDLARRHRLPLLFDAAHAFGCSAQRRMIGNFGNAEVFSFHATKFVNTLEGGAVATNDDKLAETLRLMRNNGFAGYDHVVSLGTNAKMSEVSAAMGLTCLESADRFIAANRRNYAHYRTGLMGIRGLNLLRYDTSERCNYQYIVVEVDAGLTGLRRDELVQVLFAENILARRYFYPGCHRMEPYASMDPRAGSSLPNTESLSERVLLLPTGTSVSVDDIAAICQVLQAAVDAAPAVRQVLANYGGIARSA